MIDFWYNILIGFFLDHQGAHRDSGLTGESRPLPTCQSGGLLSGEPRLQSGTIAAREPSATSAIPPCTTTTTSCSGLGEISKPTGPTQPSCPSAALGICPDSSGHPGCCNPASHHFENGHPSPVPPYEEAGGSEAALHHRPQLGGEGG